jgi:hypothetical protein
MRDKMHPEDLKTGRENIRVFSQIESDLLNGVRLSFGRFSLRRCGREEALWNQADGSPQRRSMRRSRELAPGIGTNTDAGYPVAARVHERRRRPIGKR